jgi:hypothetical protein
MYYKVKIKKLPTAADGRSVKTGQQMNGALAIQPTAMGGADIDQYIGKEKLRTHDTLGPVPRGEANLEAEKGETAYGDINGDGMAEHYKIGGKRHSKGGTPLNLPDDTFIFSDTKSMIIKDPAILKMFNKPPGKGYTPATLAKQYDINKYRKLLQDPDSTTIERKTAELMIRNYNMKLGALALAQESMKGFPQGIPMVAKPYMEANKISEQDILPDYQPKYAKPEVPGQDPNEAAENEMPAENNPMEEAMEQPGMGQGMPSPEEMAMMGQGMMQGMPMGQYGMFMGDYSDYAYGGYIPHAQTGYNITPYEEARYEKGNVTPTGKSNKYSTRGEQIKDYLSKWESTIPGISKMTEGQAQAAIYDWNLENNPDAIRAMWKEYGLTEKGLKNAKTNKLGNKGVLSDEVLSDPESLKLLKEAYVDNYFGARQLNPAEPKKEEPKKEEPKEKTKVTTCSCKDAQGVTYDPGKDANGNCIPCEETVRPDMENVDIGEAPQVIAPEWTTPDLMNYYGAIGDQFSLKKYYPWAAPVDLEEARPVYLDPTRELAAQSEQAGIANQALAMFAGPQGYSSRASQIQGTGARQAADVLSRINNANVNIANQFAGQNAQIRNQERAANQQIAKELYDQTTLTNATFDRDKRLAKGITRQAFNTGWKNASDIALINATAKQYDIDPRTGTVIFTGGKDFQPEVNKTFDKLLQGYITQGFDPKDAIAAAKTAMGQGSTGYVGPDVETIMANAKRGMFVTAPMLYPIVL